MGEPATRRSELRRNASSRPRESSLVETWITSLCVINSSLDAGLTHCPCVNSGSTERSSTVRSLTHTLLTEGRGDYVKEDEMPRLQEPFLADSAPSLSGGNITLVIVVAIVALATYFAM